MFNFGYDAASEWPSARQLRLETPTRRVDTSGRVFLQANALFLIFVIVLLSCLYTANAQTFKLILSLKIVETHLAASFLLFLFTQTASLNLNCECYP